MGKSWRRRNRGPLEWHKLPPDARAAKNLRKKILIPNVSDETTAEFDRTTGIDKFVLNGVFGVTTQRIISLSSHWDYTDQTKLIWRAKPDKSVEKQQRQIYNTTFKLELSLFVWGKIEFCPTCQRIKALKLGFTPNKGKPILTCPDCGKERDFSGTGDPIARAYIENRSAFYRK